MNIQDVGGQQNNGEIAVYHTHGFRQYMGTCKMHKTVDCPHLKSWRPEKGFAKIVMREYVEESVLKGMNKCKTCWK